MAKNFNQLRAKMSPESQKRSREKAAEMIKAMPLAELREARHLTQETVANILGINQAAVSKMEHRTDIYISTLRDYIRAMGGSLEMRAKFPEGSVLIEEFGKV